jgi:hypothetical protein
MSDILLLVIVVGLPALVVLGPLALMALGVAAVADLDGNGLVRPAQPAPGSLSTVPAAEASVTTGPARRMSSVTPSA